MKALVVGGTGLIGSSVARALADSGAEVLCVSRSGEAAIGTGVRGDVRQADLGLQSRELAGIRDGLTHMVSCFSSVDVLAGPQTALGTHRAGTQNVLRLAASCPSLERVVHVSSVLVFGRTSRRVGNADLVVGQRFRSWYEYGKLLAEQEARSFEDVPVRVLRIGDTLGPEETFARSIGGGLAACLVAALRGYPFYLQDGGRFPVYASDATTTGEMVVRALTSEDGGPTWTWFDPARPTLADVLIGLTSAWGVMPRILHTARGRTLLRLASPAVGVPTVLYAYAEPWVDIDPAVLEEIPGELPRCPPGYIEAAGEGLRRHASHLGVAA